MDSFLMMSFGPMRVNPAPAYGEGATPVPTRRNSIRFVSTYSGFHGESQLLLGSLSVGRASNEHPEGQGERIHSDLPIYAP